MVGEKDMEEDNKIESDRTICPGCGKEIPTETNFCPYCNAEIETSPVEKNKFKTFIDKIKENKRIVVLSSVFLLIILILGIYTHTLHKNYTILQSRNQTLNEQIADTQRKNSELSSDLEKVNEDYATLKANYDELLTKYNNSNTELQKYKDQQATIDDLNSQITELQSQYDSLQKERDSLQKQVDAKKAAQEQAAREQEQEELESQSYGTVYWTSGGECYHSTPNCPTLKRSSNISSGSISSAGGRRPCKVCH